MDPIETVNEEGEEIIFDNQDISETYKEIEELICEVCKYRVPNFGIDSYFEMITHVKTHIVNDEREDKIPLMSIKLLNFELERLQILETEDEELANEILAYPDNPDSETVSYYRAMSDYHSTLTE